MMNAERTKPGCASPLGSMVKDDYDRSKAQKSLGMIKAHHLFIPFALFHDLCPEE